MVANTVGGPPARPIPAHKAIDCASSLSGRPRGSENWVMTSPATVHSVGCHRLVGQEAYEIPFLKMFDLPENTVSYEARDLDWRASGN